MDPEEFERWVAQWFTERGYQTSLTASSGDQGIDVLAKRDNRTIAIQAKAYSSGNPVGSPEVQRVSGLLARSDIDEVVLFTTSSLTKQARQVAQNRDIHVLNVELRLTVSDLNYIGPNSQAFLTSSKNDTQQSTYECPHCGAGIDEHDWFSYYKHFRDCKLSDERPSQLSKREWQKAKGKLFADSRSPIIEYTCPACGYEFEQKRNEYQKWFRYANHFENCKLPDTQPEPLSLSEWEKLKSNI